MKARLSFFLVLCSTVVVCQAQVYVGPVAGGQISWTNFDESKYRDAYTVSPVWGFHAGAQVSLKVRNRFFLHTSFLYSTKGRKVQGDQDELLTNTSRYNYFEVPVIYAVDFRGRFGKGKEFKYFLGIGPNVSYWLGGKGTLYNSDLAESADYAGTDLEYRITFKGDAADANPGEMNVSDPNRVQLGLNFATGLVLEPQPNQRILILLRYEFGHSFLSRTSNGTFTPTYYQDVLQSRNQGARLSVSYMIDLRTEDRKKGKSTIKPKRM